MSGNCNAIRKKGAATLGGKCNGATGRTATYATGVANATKDATSAAAVGSAGHAAANDAATADANNGTATTNATRDATYDGAYATCKRDGAAAAIRRTESVRTDLLTGRGKF